MRARASIHPRTCAPSPAAHEHAHRPLLPFLQVQEVAALVERLHCLTPGWLLAGEQWKVGVLDSARGGASRGMAAPEGAQPPSAIIGILCSSMDLQPTKGRPADSQASRASGPTTLARALGCPPQNSARLHRAAQAFLYVSTQRRVVGLLVAEPLRQAFRVVAQAAGQEADSQPGWEAAGGPQQQQQQQQPRTAIWRGLHGRAPTHAQQGLSGSGASSLGSGGAGAGAATSAGTGARGADSCPSALLRTARGLELLSLIHISQGIVR